MNPRIDLDGTLKRWPAPTRAESFWEERAHAIVRAAISENKNTELLEALMRAPPLPGEPGETSAPGAGSAAGPRSKRASLREMAERHSSRVGLLRQQEDAAVEARAMSQRAANDGGTAAAMSARAPAATAAEPPASTAPRGAVIALPAKKKGTGGLIAGAAIAAVGLAAAFAIVQRDRITPPATPPASARVEAEQDRAGEPAARATPPADQASPGTTVALAEIPSQRPSAPPAPNTTGKASPADSAAPATTASPAPDALAQGPSTAPTTTAPTPSPTAPEAPKHPENVGVEGPNAPQPALNFDDGTPQQPAPGAISAALGPFMGTARKCVAGATEPSRASITFSSNGSVKSVIVTGWAASNGASGCITSAFMGANVGKFWKHSYTVNKTISP